MRSRKHTALGRGRTRGRSASINKAEVGHTAEKLVPLHQDFARQEYSQSLRTCTLQALGKEPCMGGKGHSWNECNSQYVCTDAYEGDMKMS